MIELDDSNKTKIEMQLCGTIKCADCRTTGEVRVSVELDNRNTVIADTRHPVLPYQWKELGASQENDWEWEEGYVCGNCDAKRTEKFQAAQKEKADKEAAKEEKQLAKLELTTEALPVPEKKAKKVKLSKVAKVIKKAVKKAKKAAKRAKKDKGN